MQRYDRQVRLWSDSGQQNLAQSRVVAVGSSLAMAECLKNLALAGIGGLVLSPEQADQGQYFKELCPEMDIMSSTEDCDLVLVTRGSKIPHNHAKTPVLIIESHFLEGSIELRLAEPLPILYTHPPSTADLRFTNLWPQLQRFCDSFDMPALTEQEFRHVPFCVLLAKAARGNPAETKNVLQSMRRYGDEENFDEAIANAYKPFASRVPPGVVQLIQHSRIAHGPFWQCVAALGRFVDRHDVLPVSGEIPDMTTTPQLYTSLKQIYRAKAEEDAAEVSRDTPGVPRQYVDRICRNSRFIKAIVPQADQRLSPNDPVLEQTTKQVNEPSELPPVAALIGGMAGQEATKILSGHYTPISGRFFFNGATQETQLVATCTVMN